MVAAAAFVAIFATLIGLVVWFNRRRLRRAQEDYADFADEVGLTRLSDRWLFDSRLVRVGGLFEGHPVEIEMCQGRTRAYTRLEVDYPEPLGLGLRIQVEDDEGIWTRLMRLKEVEIGVPSFDPHFILLSRDEERLKSLLGMDLRRMLLDLKYAAADVRIGDDGLYVLLEEAGPPDTLVRVLELSSRLATGLYRRAEEITRSEEREAQEASSSGAFTPLPGTLTAIDAEQDRPT